VGPLTSLFDPLIHIVLTHVSATDPNCRALSVADNIEATGTAEQIAALSAASNGQGLRGWLADLEVLAAPETDSTIRAIAEQLREDRRQHLAAAALRDALTETVHTDAPADRALTRLQVRLEQIRSDYAPDTADQFAASARTWEQMRTDPVPVAAPLIGDGLLRAGELGMIHGRDGSRKSWALLHLATALATGTYWFGVEMQPARVALVSLEDDEARIRDRLERICQTLAFTDAQRGAIDDRLVVVCPPHVDPVLDLTTQIGADSLERLVQRHAPAVLLLDHLSRLHMLPALSGLSNGMLRLSCSWIICPGSTCSPTKKTSVPS